MSYVNVCYDENYLSKILKMLKDLRLNRVALRPGVLYLIS